MRHARPDRSAPWLARLSFALALSAVAVVAVAAGLRSFAMLAVGAAAAVVSLAAAFSFLSRRGPLRWLSLAVFAAAPLAVAVVYALYSLLWVALAAAAGWLLAAMTARAALAGEPAEWQMPEFPVRRPARHPFLIMNPRAGGGKVGRFDLQRKAEDLGAEVFLLDSAEPVDVAAVACAAVARGADLLGVAGGDGTQALVAGARLVMIDGNFDAALDAVNSGNLAQFLKGRSETAQIVAITLRDVFVAESNVTYGVYSAGGVSRVVHYKPAEVPVNRG